MILFVPFFKIDTEVLLLNGMNVPHNAMLRFIELYDDSDLGV